MVTLTRKTWDLRPRNRRSGPGFSAAPARWLKGYRRLQKWVDQQRGDGTNNSAGIFHDFSMEIEDTPSDDMNDEPDLLLLLLLLLSPKSRKRHRATRVVKLKGRRRVERDVERR